MNVYTLFIYRSVANRLSEIDQQEGTVENLLGEDIEMASIAEEEDDLDEKFANQGTSTGKHSGKKKVVCIFKILKSLITYITKILKFFQL